jgi:predicted nucleic acid-binding protein
VARLVISDASPLIGLCIVDGLPWLQALFGTVWMPPEVRDEVLSGKVSRGEDAIAAAIENQWLGVWSGASSTQELPNLDEGESACIRVALAHPSPCLLLMDERAGRAVAQDLAIQVAGTAAVIALAKQRRLIPSARAVFARLHGSDFRISAEVIRTVLARVGEA